MLCRLFTTCTVYFKRRLLDVHDCSLMSFISMPFCELKNKFAEKFPCFSGSGHLLKERQSVSALLESCTHPTFADRAVVQFIIKINI